MDTKLFVRNQPGGFFAVTDREFNPSGSVFWVHAGTGTDGAGYGRNPDAPVATLDYAVGLCTADKGDVIYLMPGHAENIASAAGCVLDVAGVKVVGLGYGTLRPTLTLTTADTSKVSITAANCWFENVLVVSNYLSIATAISVGALADGLTLKNVEMPQHVGHPRRADPDQHRSGLLRRYHRWFQIRRGGGGGPDCPGDQRHPLRGGGGSLHADQQPHLLLLFRGASGAERGGLGGCDDREYPAAEQRNWGGPGYRLPQLDDRVRRGCDDCQPEERGQGRDGHWSGGRRTRELLERAERLRGSVQLHSGQLGMAGAGDFRPYR